MVFHAQVISFAAKEIINGVAFWQSWTGFAGYVYCRYV